MIALKKEAYIDDLITEWHEIYISERKCRGFVATIDLSRIKHKDVYTKFWGLNDIDALLAISKGDKSRLRNVYLSLNAFESKDGTLARKTANLAQIRNIGIDIDCYKKGLSVNETINLLQDMILHGDIPNPNLLIRSGNGVQLIYSIYGGAAPTNEVKWLTSYITRQFTGKTAHLGADFQTCTLERVFRLPGTLNVKPGFPTRLVTAEVWRQLEYSLTDLYEYCEPYVKKKKRFNLGREIPLNSYRRGNGKGLVQLNDSRAQDLIKLVELREGNIENRNILCYDYAFSLALNGLSRSHVQEAVWQMDNSFISQQKRNVLRTTSKSAYDDAEAFWKEYAKNNYTMRGLPSALVKPKKNKTIIEQQSITSAEMEHMSVLIDSEEKYKRKVAKRRTEGMRAMSEYNGERASKKEQLITLVKQLKEAGMKQKDIAEKLGITKGTVSKYLKL